MFLIVLVFVDDNTESESSGTEKHHGNALIKRSILQDYYKIVP